MKIALLGPFPADGKPAGGVECVMAALSSGLARRPEVELHVLCTVPGLPAAQILARPGLTVHRLPHPPGDRLVGHQLSVRQLGRLLRQIAPDVVHAQMAGPYGDAALRSGRPAVITLHGVGFREARLALQHSSLADRLRWSIDAWHERRVVRRATDLIAINPYIAQEYGPLTRARFHDIAISIGDGYFAAPPEVEGAAILCVARVVPRKDILTLLRAFAQIHAAVPAATLEIVGQADADLAYTAACQKLVADLGIAGAVTFLGGLHGQALVDSYGRANVLMLTSLQETEPGVIAEAMVVGRAVVATDVGGVPFMVKEGVTGRLAAAGDAAGLAAAVSELLQHPDRRRAMAAAGQAWATPRYRPEAVVERTLALYRQLLAQRTA